MGQIEGEAMKKLLLLLLLIPSVGQAADSSFGSVTTVTDANWGNGVAQVMPFTVPGLGGTLDSAMIRVRVGGSACDMQAVVFTSNSGPDALVDSSAELNITSTSQAIYALPFIQGATITASTEYYIGFWNSTTAATIIPSSASSGGVGVTYKPGRSAITDSFPAAPLTDAGYENYVLVWYTTGGAGPAVEAVIEVHSAVGAKVVHGPGTTGKQGGPE